MSVNNDSKASAPALLKEHETRLADLQKKSKANTVNLDLVTSRLRALDPALIGERRKPSYTCGLGYLVSNYIYSKEISTLRPVKETLDRKDKSLRTKIDTCKDAIISIQKDHPVAKEVAKVVVDLTKANKSRFPKISAALSDISSILKVGGLAFIQMYTIGSNQYTTALYAGYLVPKVLTALKITA
jgi:hypothetical protein